MLGFIWMFSFVWMLLGRTTVQVLLSSAFISLLRKGSFIFSENVVCKCAKMAYQNFIRKRTSIISFYVLFFFLCMFFFLWRGRGAMKLTLQIMRLPHQLSGHELCFIFEQTYSLGHHDWNLQLAQTKTISEIGLSQPVLPALCRNWSTICRCLSFFLAGSTW